MKTIDLIPYLDACAFPSDVTDWCVDGEISTHYADSVFSLDWTDVDDYPNAMSAWLVDTYGPDIKNYKCFAISAT